MHSLAVEIMSPPISEVPEIVYGVQQDLFFSRVGITFLKLKVFFLSVYLYRRFFICRAIRPNEGLTGLEGQIRCYGITFKKKRDFLPS